MTETLMPYIESDSEKDEDKKTEKKDRKKHVARTLLVAPQETVPRTPDRPLKIGSELLGPMTIELPKPPAEALPPVQSEFLQAQQAVDQELPPDDLQRMQAELMALTAEKVDDEDEGNKSNKKSDTKPVVHPGISQGAEQPAPVSTTPELTAAAFQDIVNAPELAGLRAVDASEAVQPVTVAEIDPDHDFNEIVEHALGAETLSAAKFHEQAPGESPTEINGGNSEPPLPPVAEGGRWGDGEDEPWQQPAGGLGEASIRREIDAVDARRDLDDLYHTSKESGLAGAVGLIGLGLVIEHFVAKRRDKKLKKQLDAQSRHLKKTDRTLEQEQQTNRQTRQKVGRLERAHTGTLPEVQRAHGVAVAEIVGAAHEHHKKVISRSEEKILARKLASSHELGQAIARNPELKAATVMHEKELQSSIAAAAAAAEVKIQQHHMVEHSLESATETATEQEKQIQQLKHEVSFERLKSEYQDDGDAPKRGGASRSDTRGMPMLPLPQDQLPSGLPPEHLLEAFAHPDPKSRSSSRTNWIAIATILVILAAVIVMVYIR